MCVYFIRLIFLSRSCKCTQRIHLHSATLSWHFLFASDIHPFSFFLSPHISTVIQSIYKYTFSIFFVHIFWVSRKMFVCIVLFLSHFRCLWLTSRCVFSFLFRLASLIFNSFVACISCMCFITIQIPTNFQCV